MTGVFPFTRILCENMQLSEVVRYFPGWIGAH